MAKKGKVKISKVKRNNHTTNKMRKQGQLKLQRHRTKVQKQKQPPLKPEVEYSSESESSSEEWADMLDEDEQKYIMNRLAKQPQLLSNVPEKEDTKPRSRKPQKVDKERPVKLKRPAPSDSGAESDESDSELEEKYEQELADRPAKRMRPLLPIKTKEGILERAEECEESNSESDTEKVTVKLIPKVQDEDASDSDSGMSITAEDAETAADPSEEHIISAVELLAARKERLNNDKLRIGALCSSLLESPEKKLKNFFPILYLMEERLKDGSLNLHSIRKIATLSAYEVFKDILPEYLIRHQDYSNVKLKKDTLALYKYEKELLEMYKRYLQRLEKAASVLRRKKKGDTRKVDPSVIELAVVSITCMCGLLEARASFNYATNIAQSVVPFLDCDDERARACVTSCCVSVFAQDKKGDITLVIVRLINQLVKRRGDRLKPSALDCLLSLNIREVDLDAQDELTHKKKQEEKHKKRIVNLSKKEKKRAKKLKEVEKELLETQAQESEAARKRQLTEVVKTVFHIYFRLLKSSPGSRMLVAALNGISKFCHVINVELYCDLVTVLSGLIGAECPVSTGLRAAGTALHALRAGGDALTLDPARFHTYLYSHMLHAHAGKTSDDFKTIIEAVSVIVSRARRVSAAVLQALGKRLCTAATQTLHNGALAALVVLHQLITQSKPVSYLLDLDGESLGSGRFDPYLPSPEHCHAHNTHLYEVTSLARHYHPAVREATRALLRGDLPHDLSKLSPAQILKEYDGSQMAFKPAIPPPGNNIQNKKTNSHTWAQRAFKEYCLDVEKNVDMTINIINK